MLPIAHDSEALSNHRACILGHVGNHGGAQSRAAILPSLEGLQVVVPRRRVWAGEAAGEQIEQTVNEASLRVWIGVEY
jgi:hypothetical protein